MKLERTVKKWGNEYPFFDWLQGRVSFSGPLIRQIPVFEKPLQIIGRTELEQ